MLSYAVAELFISIVLLFVLPAAIQGFCDTRSAVQITIAMTARFSQSTIRPAPSSPTLIALLELIPPSPVLTPSDLSTSITSEEIPILLVENSVSAAVPFDEQHDDDDDDDDLYSSPRSWEYDLLSKSSLLIAAAADDDDHDLDRKRSLQGSVSKELLYEEDDLDRDPLDSFGSCSGRGTHRHRRLSLCWSSGSTGSTVRGFIQDGMDMDMFACHEEEEDSWISVSQWSRDHPLIFSSALTGEEGKEEEEASAPLDDQSWNDLTSTSSPQDPIPAGATPSQTDNNDHLSLSTAATNSVSQGNNSSWSQGTRFLHLLWAVWFVNFIH